jgi:hypothetical protein
MLSLISIALTLTPVVYRIPDTPTPYALQVTFDGYIPILGGNEGKVDLSVGISVKAIAPESDGNQKAVTDVTDLKIIFNGATLPFGKDQVEKYFPNTVTLTPQGKVVKNDAPNIDLPVQLPGLDVKRFPDITYLTVEFPAEGIELGKEWAYSRQFGPGNVDYTVRATSITDSSVEMDVTLKQRYDGKEDEAHNLVKDDKDAVADIHTEVEGGGHVSFDRKAALIRSSNITANAISTVTDRKAKTQTTRKLKTILAVTLKK